MKNKETTKSTRNQDPFLTLPEPLCSILAEQYALLGLPARRRGKAWYRSVPQDKPDSWIGYHRQSLKEGFLFAIAPVLENALLGKRPEVGETLEILLNAGNLPVYPEYSIDDNFVGLRMIIPTHSVPDSEVGPLLDDLQVGIDEFRIKLLDVSNELMELHLEAKAYRSEPSLPNVRMTPKEMGMLWEILFLCDDPARMIFNYLMETWEKRGYRLHPSPTHIALNPPPGTENIPLAFLLPGTLRTKAKIGLQWKGLKRYKAFPQTAILDFQKEVSSLVDLRETETSAYVEITPDFTLVKARKLFSALDKLAKSIRLQKTKAVLLSQKRTAAITADTLAVCDPKVGALFQILIDRWRVMGGIVHGIQPGRIYLRMRTRAHQSGSLALRTRQFNLVTLVAPKEGNPARIEITWDLGTARHAEYLDCIPVEVARFEKKVASLPGFWRRGTRAGFDVTENFSPLIIYALVEAMEKLLNAEERAI